MRFQRVDGGLHRAVLPAQRDELGVSLSFSINGAEPAFLGHCYDADDPLELGLVVHAVEPLVHADAAQRSKTLLGLLDDVHRDRVIGGLLHHLVVQDEPVLVFDDARAQAQFHRNSCFALDDPIRMRLEQGEDLLCVRNALALQYPATDLIDLAHGVAHELVEFLQQALEQHELGQALPGAARAIQKASCLVQIVPVRRAGGLKLLFALDLVLGAGVLELLRLPVQPLELPQVVGTLAPLGQAVLLAHVGGDLDGLAHRVPQQIDVGGIVNVGLDHEGITARGEAPSAGLFFTSMCPALTTS